MTPLICHIFIKCTLPLIFHSKMGDFLHTREANEICAESKTSSLTCCNTDTWRDGIEDGEDDRGEDGEGRDLIERKRLLRDKDSSGSNH